MSGIVRGVGKVFGKIMGIEEPRQQQAPMVIMPPPVPQVAPPPQSQAAQVPDQAAVRNDSQVRRGAIAAMSNTMLTGPGGVDPRLLSIGKTTGNSVLGS